ncbi:MAG: glycoside hydrolase family 3 N-terminal domain-containing protein, partial [Candidatus Neomarinimicrobiota bacterium]|nr:glycoside hydrolase family 3 N-terminal domain-containing protein [Candidatus Neomarinimicrobiota bacterium]
LWSIEIPPFKSMINAGVDAVMVAHIHAPDYQPEANTPASMDSYWIQDILRDRLNFNGTIVTDAMGMGGITKNYSDAYALVEAVGAGCDVIIQNYDIKKSINTVEEAVKRGQISEERINEAALKMLRMKEKVGIHLNSQISLEVALRVLSRN